MGRWEANSPQRLRHAALELYAERGFDAVTVAEIAERAGLTERTFYRHFIDKREVLFPGSAELPARLAGIVTAAPATATPMEAVMVAILEFGQTLPDVEHVRLRQRVINANPELRERELIKLSLLAEGMAEALVDRGVAPVTAGLAAETGVAVFKTGFAQWLAGSAEADLAGCVTAALRELKSVTG